MNSNYGISLEKKFKKANRKAFVLFEKENDILHDPFLLLKKEDISESVIVKINNLCLERGYNPIYFSRNNILRIREIKKGKSLPLNKKAVCSSLPKLNSS